MLLTTKRGGIIPNSTVGIILAVIILVIGIIVLVAVFTIFAPRGIDEETLESYENIVEAANSLLASGSGSRKVDFVTVNSPWVINAFKKGDFPCRESDCICVCRPKTTCSKEKASDKGRRCTLFESVDSIEFDGFSPGYYSTVEVEFNNNVLKVSKKVDNKTKVQSENETISKYSQAAGVDRYIMSAVMDHSQKNGLDPALTLAVIKQESSFVNTTLGDGDFKGLMQLSEIAVREVFSVDEALAGKYGGSVDSIGSFNAFNTEQNVEVGSRYLRLNLDIWSEKDGEEQLKFAIAAYNAGDKTIRDAVAKVPEPLFKEGENGPTWEEVSPYAPRETQDYIPKVLGFYEDFRTKLSSS